MIEQLYLTCVSVPYSKPKSVPPDLTVPVKSVMIGMFISGCVQSENVFKIRTEVGFAVNRVSTFNVSVSFLENESYDFKIET